ncbi:HD domain-containing protein [Patescibacteria group bacterium]|nr:HD domain-containing protein [Patescibacteria group bacterium]
MTESFLDRPDLYSTTLYFLQEIKNRSELEQTPIMEGLFGAAQYYGELRRKSGNLYILHPLQVAALLAQSGADQDTIVAGLLHDVLEDTETGAGELKHRFGEAVYQLVEAVTHQKMFSTKEHLEKVYSKSRKDPRVAWIKIADRCSNLTDYHLVFSLEKQREFLQETETFYLAELAEVPDLPRELVRLLARLTEKLKEQI